jgi:OmpA-OmpF porin, OOP family
MIARKLQLAATALASTLVTSLTLASGAAQAQTTVSQSPFYFGGSIGAPRWDVDGAGGSNSGAGLKLYGGWALTPNFALEAGALDLGKLSRPGASVRGDGLFLDAVGTMPLEGPWSVIGRLGVVNSKLKVPGDSDRGTGIRFGLGGQYQLNTNVALRAEWERNRLSAFGDHPKADLWSIGAKYSF